MNCGQPTPKLSNWKEWFINSHNSIVWLRNCSVGLFECIRPAALDQPGAKLSYDRMEGLSLHVWQLPGAVSWDTSVLLSMASHSPVGWTGLLYRTVEVFQKGNGKGCKVSWNLHVWTWTSLLPHSVGQIMSLAPQIQGMNRLHPLTGVAAKYIGHGFQPRAIYLVMAKSSSRC